MWLAVPTSVFCAALLPVAYIAFFLLMNQKTFMGDDMPRGLARVIWNVLMLISVSATAALSFWALWSQGGKLGDLLGLPEGLGSYLGLGIFVGFGLLVLIVHIARKKNND